MFLICLSLLINQTLNIHVLLMKEKLLFNASKKNIEQKECLMWLQRDKIDSKQTFSQIERILAKY